MQMTRIVLATALTLAVLLLCGSPSQIEAQSNTKIVIKDGGSILMHADGIDDGKTWSVSRDELRHQNARGLLSGVEISDGNAGRCGHSATCGVRPARPWTIQVSYGAGSVTISSVSANKGVHLTHSGLPFDQWKTTANADERMLGHGDGNHITGISVNHGDNLCSGKGACELTLLYSPR